MASKKRKQIVVDKNFQFRLVSAFLFSILAALFIFSLLVAGYYWISSMAGENIFKEFITIDRQVTRENTVIVDGVEKVVKVPATETVVGVKRWEIILPVILVNNLVLMLVFSVLGIRYSHRIAGPVYRISMDIQRVLGGEPGVRIKLRATDRLQGLGVQVNKFIEEYEKVKRES